MFADHKKNSDNFFLLIREIFPFSFFGVSCCKRAIIETGFSYFLWRYRCKWKYNNTVIDESNSGSVRTNAISVMVKLLWFYKKFNLKDFEILFLLWLYVLMLVLKVASELRSEYWNCVKAKIYQNLPKATREWNLENVNCILKRKRDLQVSFHVQMILANLAWKFWLTHFSPVFNFSTPLKR